MAFPRKIRIREVGPRDGLQTISQVIPTVKKLELIHALVAAGATDIEVTAFVRPDRVPQMADAEELVRGIKPLDGVHYRALYLNERGFERAQQFQQIDNQAWLYGAASETFLKNNNNLTHAAFYASIPNWIALFRTHRKALHGVMISAAFGCNWEGEIKAEKLLAELKSISNCLSSQGEKFRELCLADTMGWASPEKLKRTVELVRDSYPELEISLHLHDTRGTGLANVYAALQIGVQIFDGSVGGLGGCPFALGAAGNVATEELVFLCDELGIETGIDLGRYLEVARLAESIVGSPLPGRLYKASKLKFCCP